MTDQLLIALELPAVRRLIKRCPRRRAGIRESTDPEMAALLRADADRLERRLFAQRPIAYRPGPLDVRIEEDA